ncbi:MAG: sugar ABC transporter permease [Lachnospiraceae bacterium]|nr:sugar ABC transporter permease [Lachnospiraceae bacterium]
MPSIAGVVLFVLLPFADVGKRSFQTAVTGEFCGIDNYKVVFENQAFLLAIKNTLKLVMIGLPLLLVVSLLISLVIYQFKWVQGLKSAFLFPMAVPTATVVLIWKMLFHNNGLMNAGLENIGLKSIDWLGSNASFWVLIISYIWKNLGYTIVLWLAGLHNISEGLKEAARVDGASEIKCFFYVVLPGLKPVLYTITILSFLNSFKVFREAYLVAGAYPQQDMYLLQHLFNNWFTRLEMDKIAASAVCITIVFIVFALFLQHIWEEEK